MQTTLMLPTVSQPFLGLLTMTSLNLFIKDTAMQIEKALTNDRLRVSKVTLKFCILAFYEFAVIYP